MAIGEESEVAPRFQVWYRKMTDGGFYREDDEFSV